MKKIVFAVVMLFALSLFAGTGVGVFCDDFDVADTTYPLITSENSIYHTMDDHFHSPVQYYSLDYSPTTQKDQYGNWKCWCVVTANFDVTNSRYHEDGTLYPTHLHYVTAGHYDSPPASGYSPTIYNSDVMEVNHCISGDPTCGYIGVTYNSSPTPIVTFHEGTTGTLLMDDRQAMNTRCPPETATHGTPIYIPLGTPFEQALTSADEGVTFTFSPHYGPAQISWTALGAKGGWLVLDRDGNGKIDSGKELFGNITQQMLPETDEAQRQFQPNGFNALALLDKKYGNGDGVLDASDQIWTGIKTFCGGRGQLPCGAKLQVWVDTCHCGDSTRGTMYDLTSLGITSISLQYTKAKKTDQHGNAAEWQSTMTYNGNVVTIYDIALRQQ